MPTQDRKNESSPGTRPPQVGKTRLPVDTGNLNILHVEDIHINSDYDSIHKAFSKFGAISEIRMDMKNDTWEAWLSFANHNAALEASINIKEIYLNNCKVKGALCEKAPTKLDIYKPDNYNEINNPPLPIVRVPKPPTWIIASGKKERYNYCILSKFLQKKVGTIKSENISRFGSQSVLIHANSDTQAHMLCNLKIEEEGMLKQIKPHYNFSYGRGVIFDRDLYEFPEEEILEMCPKNVFKVAKIPRTSMIILTYETPNVPDYIIIENERLKVREYKQRPMQCFNCFRFGHPSNACRNEKICINCSAQEHGHCTKNMKCANCHEAHKANDKSCLEYKKEADALIKANSDHISVGYAKKLLGQLGNYAQAVKIPQPSNITTLNKSNTGTIPKISQRPKKQNHVNSIDTAQVLPNNVAPQRVTAVAKKKVLSNSQESLPDLRETSPKPKPNKKTNTRKRERPHSYSPPSSPRPSISNRYNILSSVENLEIIKSQENVEPENGKPKEKKLIVEVHPSPRQDREVGPKPPKINLSRTPSQPTDSNGHRSRKKDAETKLNQLTSSSKVGTSGKT